MANPAPKLPPVDTRFKPGQSGNPSGRPKGPKPSDLAVAVRKKASPDEIAEFHYAVFRGDSEKLGFTPTPEMRIAEGQWLATRGYGKEVTFKEQEEEDALGYTDVATAGDEITERVLRLAAGADEGRAAQ